MSSSGLTTRPVGATPSKPAPPDATAVVPSSVDRARLADWVEGRRTTIIEKWHGSQFDVRTGEVKCGPAKEEIETYPLADTPAKTA